MQTAVSDSVEAHPILVPSWLEELVQRLTDYIEPLPAFAMTYYWWEPGNPHNLFPGWQLALVPQAIETVGGAHDGEVEAPGFSVNVGKIEAFFCRLDLVTWRVSPVYNTWLDGPHLSLSGEYLDHKLWLRLYQLPATDEPLKLDSKMREPPAVG